MGRLIERRGERHGRLLVVRYSGTSRSGPRWLCRCECGTETIVIGTNLKSGHTKSCGCLHQDRQYSTHGRTRGAKMTGVYSVWRSMITRCTNSNVRSWRQYGGRGIRVCDRWRTDYSAFELDMGPRPSGTSLDRIDVNGHYEPSNCRWASRDTQSLNTRQVFLCDVADRPISLVMIARHLAIPKTTLHRYLQAAGVL